MQETKAKDFQNRELDTQNCNLSTQDKLQYAVDAELLDYPLAKFMEQKIQRIGSQIMLNIQKPEPYVATIRKDQPIKKMDLSQLKKNIEKAINASEKVKGKDTVFIVGKTGAGKSTSIHFLTGIKLFAKQPYKSMLKQKQDNKSQEQAEQIEQLQQEEQIMQKDETLIKDFILEPQEMLQGFKIGHQNNSQTSILNVYELDQQVLVDTVGLFDTKGVQYDIANAVGLQKAFSKAKSIKFILVIAQTTVKEPRGVDLRSLISQFLGYVPKIDIEQLLPAITVIISRCMTDPISLINQLQKTAKTKDEPSFKVLETVKEMYKKLKRLKGAKINFVGLGTQKNMTNPEQGYNWLDRIKKSKKIQGKQKQFSLSLKRDAISFIHQKNIQLQREVRVLAEKNRYNKLKEYLDELQYLKKNINLQQINRNSLECIKCINGSMKDLLKQYKKDLDISMSLQGSLSDEGITSLKQNLQSIKEAQNLKQLNNYSFDENVTFSNASNYMYQKMKDISQYVKNNIKDLKFMFSIMNKLQKLYLKFGDQIFKVKQFYENFCLQTEKVVVLKIKQIIKLILKGNYKGIVEPFKFLKSIEDICKNFLKINLSEVLQNIKKLANQTLKFRFQQGMKPILLKINLDNVENLKKIYRKWKIILKNDILSNILGQQTLKNIFDIITEQINKFFKNKIKQINDKIEKKIFEELQQPLMTFKQLRDIDTQYSSQTCDEYFSVLNKFNIEIMNDSKDILETSIRKITLGTINQQQIYILKQKISKLKQMLWLQKVMGKGSVLEILNKLINVLQKQAKNLKDGLSNLINIQMVQIQEQLCNSADLDQSFESQLKSLKISRISTNKQTKKFIRVNDTLMFLKNIGQINQKIQNIFQQAKSYVQSVIKQKVQLLKQYISQKQRLQIHKSQIGSILIKIFYMKSIKFSPLNIIQDIFLSTSNILRNHINQVIKQIENTDLSQIEDFKNKSTNILSLINQFDSSSVILKKYKIDINERKKAVLKEIEHKFDQLFQNITQFISDGKLEQVKKLLEILKKYKVSKLNQQMDNRLKQKFDQLTQKYQTFITAIPKQIQNYFNQERFTQFQALLSQYKKTKSDQNYTKLLNQIYQIIQNQFQNIYDDISCLIVGGNVEYLKLNKMIKKFISYSKIQDLVDKAVHYKQKKTLLAQNIKKYYTNLLEDIQKSIKILKFKNIKFEIEKFNKINSILMIGIYDIEFKLQFKDIKKQILDKKVQQIHDTNIEVGKFSWYINAYDKIKILDLQYGSDHSQQIRKKLNQQIRMICKSIQQEAQKATSLQILDTCHKKLKDLKNDISQSISTKLQFNEIFDLIKDINENIDNLANTFLHNSRYNNEYLERLRQKDTKNYTKIIAELKNQFQGQVCKIQDSFERFDYIRIYQGIKSLQKFDPVNKLIKSQKYKSPNDYKAKIQQKVNEQYQKLFIKVQAKFIARKFDSHIELKKLLNIHIASKGAISKQKMQQLHCRTVSYFKSTIPQLDQKAPFDAQFNKIKILKKQSILIEIFKKYIGDIQQVYTIADKSNIVSYFLDLRIADQYEKDVYDNIRKLPLQINNLWEKYHYRQISNKLGQVKKIGSSEAERAFYDLSQLVKKLLKDKGQKIRKNIKHQEFKQVNEDLNKISEAQNQMKGILGLIEKQMQHKTIIKQVCDKIEREIVLVAQKKLQGKNISQVVTKIMELKKWTDNLPIIQDKIEEKVTKILNIAKKKNLTGQLVSAVQKIAHDSTSNNKEVAVCKQLMFKYSKELSVPRILPKLRMSINDAIAKFNGQKQNSINKVELRRVYDIYEQQFQKQKDQYIAKGGKQMQKKNLLAIKDRVKSLMNNIQKKQLAKNEIRQTIPQVLANIFVYWSLKKSGQSFYEARQLEKDPNDYLLQPHPIQVLSILRFIGCDEDKSILQTLKQKIGISVSKLQNHIMQIKTGQGKSVILGSMSILLAIMGHKVYCVCYSSYLSERDYEDFRQIFQELQVSDKISYGTFNQISEQLINQKSDVRNLANSLFMPKIHKREHKKQQIFGSRILLVDQVDTFFSREFYGATYNPMTLLKNQQINQIIEIIWKNKAQNPDQVKNIYQTSTAYKKLAEEYKDCIQRIDQQLFYMVKDAKQYNSRDYIVQEGKIGYKQLDGISFNSVFGYQTMYTYIYESQPQRGNVSKEKAQEYKGISITCGQYSYAEMIQNFDKIFGVTGTLESLSKFEQSILDRYKVCKKTYAPSVYGDSLREERAILIQNDKKSQYQQIATKIQVQLKKGRSILVFFENQKQLAQFQKSQYVQRLRQKIKIVTQKTVNRSYHIKKATTSGMATLFTAPFGRGTDFQIFDPIVQKQGVGVIQAFLSQQQSEEIQIKGRTARQGKSGTYQLILNMQKLQSKYKITPEIIKKARETQKDSVNNLLHRTRVKYLEEVNKERQKVVDRSKEIHIKSTQMKQKMNKINISRNQEFFFRNCVSTVGDKARILCMIDATGSMGTTINQVKGKVMNMIDGLAQKYPAQFQIQLMFYYGINSYDGQKPPSGNWCYNNKIHASQWSSNTNVLKKFMSTVTASGGSHHQAIQLGLHHLLISFSEVGVAKGILIGDDGLENITTSSMVYHVHPQDKHRYKGRQTTNIVETLNISTLLSSLKSSGISIDSYPIGAGRTQTTFQQISTYTGGKCKAFNPSTDNLSAEIETTITECIIMKR